MLKIYQDDAELLSGDDTSINMIFNNLIGKNIKGAEYATYLNFMSRELNLEIIPTQLAIKSC